MERGWTLFSVGTGAGLMYLLDPDRGRRRRALLRDKAVHMKNESRRALGLASRDLVNRSRGVVAEVRHKISSGDAPDDVLRERVRARIGHVVSHPHAIHVAVDDGCVTLSGAILSDEVEECLTACAATPGVTDVESELEVHEGPDIPALVGGRRPTENVLYGPRPATQLLTGVGGLACILIGRRRGGIIGLALRGLGLTLLAAELTNLEGVQELVGEASARLTRLRGESGL